VVSAAQRGEGDAGRPACGGVLDDVVEVEVLGRSVAVREGLGRVQRDDSVPQAR
jgi:hypothetical protein